MRPGTRYVGMDVHKDSIAVAVVEADGAELQLGLIPNHPEALRKLVRRVGPAAFAYEAGPCSYAVYQQVQALGHPCMVAAPGLVPRKPGDRVKTDRRAARKLARSLRAGDLTAVWVPDAAHEALRDLVRAHGAARTDRLRHRLTKFLLRLDVRPPAGVRPWRQPYRAWLAVLRLPRAANRPKRPSWRSPASCWASFGPWPAPA